MDAVLCLLRTPQKVFCRFVASSLRDTTEAVLYGL